MNGALTFSICFTVIPIATDTNNLFDAIVFTSSRTVGTTPGFTDTNTTSDSSTTGELSVSVLTPNAYKI